MREEEMIINLTRNNNHDRSEAFIKKWYRVRLIAQSKSSGIRIRKKNRTIKTTKQELDYNGFRLKLRKQCWKIKDQSLPASEVRAETETETEIWKLQRNKAKGERERVILRNENY